MDEANSRSIAEFVAETNFGNNEFDKSILPIAIVLFDAYGSPELKESLQRGVGKKKWFFPFFSGKFPEETSVA